MSDEKGNTTKSDGTIWRGEHLRSPRNRYHHDQMFRTLVDTLWFQLREARYTPTEIREAAMLAQIMYEEERPPRYPPVSWTGGAPGDQTLSSDGVRSAYVPANGVYPHQIGCAYCGQAAGFTGSHGDYKEGSAEGPVSLYSCPRCSKVTVVRWKRMVL